MKKIGFIGMGNMAKALAKGFIGSGVRLCAPSGKVEKERRRNRLYAL